MEEEMDSDRQIPLRNGAGKMSLGAGRIAREELRILMTKNNGPELATALRFLAEGQIDRVSEEQFAALKNRGLLTRAGGVRPDIAMVLKATYKDTPAGAIIEAEPFDLSNPEDARAVQSADDFIKNVGKRTTGWVKLVSAESRGAASKKGGNDSPGDGIISF